MLDFLNKTPAILILFSKLIGIIPFNHRKPNSENASDYILMFLIPIGYIASIAFLFTYPTPTLTPDSLYLTDCKSICFIGNLTFLCLGAFCYSICLLSSIRKRKFFLYFYDATEKFDQHLRQLDPIKLMKIKRDYVKIIMVLIMIISLFGVLIYSTLSFGDMQNNYLLYAITAVCCFFPLIVSSTYQLLFVNLIEEIGWRFEKINFVFKLINKQCNIKTGSVKIFDIELNSTKKDEISDSKDNISIGNVSTVSVADSNQETDKEQDDDSDDSENDDLPDIGDETRNCERYMVDLFEVHDKISSLGVQTNKEFAPPVVAYMTTTFVISILGIFLATKVLFTIGGKNAYLDKMAIAFVLWTVFVLIVAYLVLRLCCHAQTESRKTALLIHEIMQKKPSFMLGNDDYYNKMKCFTLQYLHWESFFHFNGIGLFQLDYTFIFSAVSAATSYLIVLLQFDMNSVL